MSTRRRLLLIVIMIISNVAYGAIFKCETPEGITYAEKPCTTNDSKTLSQIPLSTETQSRANKRDFSNMRLVAEKPRMPANNTTDLTSAEPKLSQNQTRLYQEFVLRPTPRVFAICKDGGTITIVGTDDFVQREKKDIRYGCKIYAVNNQVVGGIDHQTEH